MSEEKNSLDMPRSHCYIPIKLRGDQMRAIREANGLTQAQVAEMLGVSRVAITQFETGYRPIVKRTALAFAAVVNDHKRKLSRRTPESQTA